MEGDGSLEGRHSFTVSGTKFEVDKRYELIKPIGHGAYGVVVSAVDKKTNQKVAIKKVPRAFDDLIDAKRILREIKLLRHFNHENIISLKDILQPPRLDDFEDVYIISDLMETDLHRIIYSKQQLSDDHVQYFVYQMLRSLKYMHSANVSFSCEVGGGGGAFARLRACVRACVFSCTNALRLVSSFCADAGFPLIRCSIET